MLDIRNSLNSKPQNYHGYKDYVFNKQDVRDNHAPFGLVAKNRFAHLFLKFLACCDITFLKLPAQTNKRWW